MSWSPPRIASRTGAAHRRRGTSCQDCSGWVRLETGPVWAMAVADGHGNARHPHSRDGSRIACEVSLELILEPFARGEKAAWGEAADPAAMARALERDLSAVIVSRWRERVRRHWRAQRVDGERFSPLLYGSTLGLVLLTPRWWAHTGLGDWDLVRVDADGQARLLSQEGDAGGDATASLCLTDAARCFPARTGVHPLAPDAPPFALLLSSDGVRKSCGSDADFLTLAAYLADRADEAGVAEGGEPAADPLDTDLDRISDEGSGDDVSVAIARWGLAAGGDGEPVEPAGGSIERGGLRLRLCQPEPLAPVEPPESPPAALPVAPAMAQALPQPEHRGGRVRLLASGLFLLLLALTYAGSVSLVGRLPGSAGAGQSGAPP